MNTFKTEGEEKWAQVIGQVMLGFADIEYITLQCLHVFPSENIFSCASKLSLSLRIELIIDIVDSRFQNSENTASMINYLKRAKELSVQRNIIAHNPMSFEVYEDEAGNITGLKEAIISMRKNNAKLHFADLVKLNTDVNETKQLLMDEFSALTKDIRVHHD